MTHNESKVMLITGEDCWSWKSAFWDRDNKVHHFGCTSEYMYCL